MLGGPKCTGPGTGMEEPAAQLWSTGTPQSCHPANSAPWPGAWVGFLLLRQPGASLSLGCRTRWGCPWPRYRSVSSCERHGSQPHELGSCTMWLINHVSLESAGTLEKMQHLEILMAPFAVPTCSWSLLPALFTLQAGPCVPGHQGISRELKGFRAAGTVPSPHPSLSACSTPSTFLQLINLLV